MKSKRITCPNCMHLNSGKQEWCSRCGIVMNEYEKNKKVKRYKGIKKQPKKQKRPKEDWLVGYEKSEKIILTTSFYLSNKEIEQEVEVITSECVLGINIFKDLMASVRDVFGGRSETTQNVLREARRTVLAELRREAIRARADAVIGIDLDYQELTGGGKNGMLMIVASGTAVTVKKDENPNSPITK